jgi:hypothetical protein
MLREQHQSSIVVPGQRRGYSINGSSLRPPGRGEAIRRIREVCPAGAAGPAGLPQRLPGGRARYETDTRARPASRRLRRGYRRPGARGNQ